MIGLIIWVILIIIIAECACPGLIWVVLASAGVYAVVYLAVTAIVEKLKRK